MPKSVNKMIYDKFHSSPKNNLSRKPLMSSFWLRTFCQLIYQQMINPFTYSYKDDLVSTSTGEKAPSLDLCRVEDLELEPLEVAGRSALSKITTPSL